MIRLLFNFVIAGFLTILSICLVVVIFFLLLLIGTPIVCFKIIDRSIDWLFDYIGGILENRKL